jgi:hypothetical protein
MNTKQNEYFLHMARGGKAVDKYAMTEINASDQYYCHNELWQALAMTHMEG